MSKYKPPNSKKSVEKITNYDIKETLEDRIKKELCGFCGCNVLLESFSIERLISNFKRLEFFPGNLAYYNGDSRRLTISDQSNKALRIVEFK